MASTPFTEALARAAELHESTQALAHELRVPENTLLRWMSGRAQMPLRALHHLIALLVEHERRAGAVPDGGPVASVTLSLGDAHARCAGCGGVSFNAPGAPLRMTSVLVCASCEAPALHADLLAALATSVMTNGRARPPRRRESPALTPAGVARP